MFIIEACVSKEHSAQRKLFELYYAYGISIALRYAKNKADAEEILSDAFLKVFLKIDQFDKRYEFKKWFRRIVINTSIDFLRKDKSFDTIYPEDDTLFDSTFNTGWENLVYEDVLKAIQTLPKGYRKVFNLYAIDGYKHREISKLLGISVGTSKSNYARGRTILQKYLISQNKEQVKHG